MTHRILITGGKGYLGGRIAQHLSARTDLFLMLGTRERSPAPPWLPSAGLTSMVWSDAKSLHAAVEGVDTIVHLAAMNDAECAADPVRALEINGVNTVRLVDAARRAGVKRFIYMSTTHVYGPQVGRLEETTLPAPRHPYATSHRAAEDAVLAAGSSLTAVVLRLSNGFGAPTHAQAKCWTLLVNDLCRQAVIDGALKLRSAGLQRRDFIPLTDVVRIVDHMLHLDPKIVGDGIFNAGSGRSMRVIEIAELVRARCEAILGFCPDIVRPEPVRGETTPELDYRIDKLMATGFIPSATYAEEIDAELAFCRDAFVTRKEYGRT